MTNREHDLRDEIKTLTEILQHLQDDHTDVDAFDHRAAEKISEVIVTIRYELEKSNEELEDLTREEPNPFEPDGMELAKQYAMECADGDYTKCIR